MNDELAKIWNNTDILSFSPSILPGWTEENPPPPNLGQDAKISNPRPHECEAGIPTTRPDV